MKKTKNKLKNHICLRSVVPISSSERKPLGMASARADNPYYVILKLCDLVQVCLTLSPYTAKHN